MRSIYTYSALDSTHFESWIVCIISSVSSFASILSIITFLKFSFLYAHPRNLFFFFTCVDSVAGILVVIGFALKTDPCVEIHIAYAVFMYAFFIEFMWLSAISHAIFCELKEKKLSIWIMKNTTEAIERDMIIPKSEMLKVKERRYKSYHLICWGLPTVYYAIVLFVSSPCDGDVHAAVSTTFFTLFRMMTYLLTPSQIWLVPEILTLLFSIYYAIRNAILARECIRLLGLGTDTASIDGTNFSRYGVYLGMVCVFGLTRFPAVCSALLRVILDDHLHTTVSKVLLAIDAFLSPMQGVFLFMWFSTKFKYLELWWTLKWFRDFVRCRYCCHHHNHQDEDEDEGDELDISYSLMDDGDTVLDDAKTDNSSTSRTPSSNRRSIVAMPVIETFTGMF